ncbi:MAG: 3'-5' exonuclease [Lawsonella sp.]
MTHQPFDPHYVCSFDLETTGPNPRTARIVTSSCLDIDDDTVAAHNWLANPGIDIPAGATAVHGITTEHAVKHGEPHSEVVAATIDHIYECWAAGRALIVYNANFDLTILQHWEPSFEIRGLVFDPFVVDRAMDPYRRGKRTLSNVCAHYAVQLDNAHQSADDAWAASQVALKLTEKYPELLDKSSDELMALQTQWHKKKQESFREWLTSQGRDASTVESDWPLLSLS